MPFILHDAPHEQFHRDAFLIGTRLFDLDVVQMLSRNARADRELAADLRFNEIGTQRVQQARSQAPTAAAL